MVVVEKQLKPYYTYTVQSNLILKNQLKSYSTLYYKLNVQILKGVTTSINNSKNFKLQLSWKLKGLIRKLKMK